MNFMRYRRGIVLLMALSLPLFSSCRSDYSNQDIMSQIAVTDTLFNGAYKGTFTCGEIKQFGDFGTGIFNAFDGEMILLDGKVYHIKADGYAEEAADSDTLPFATATFFKSNKKVKLPSGMIYGKIEKVLDEFLAPESLFYAIKITGHFTTVKTRSFSRQKRPFPPFESVMQHQKISEYEDVRGTVLGFRCPDYADGVNIPGDSLYFISDDKDKGGQVIDFHADDITVEIDTKRTLFITLP